MSSIMDSSQFISFVCKPEVFGCYHEHEMGFA